MVIVIEEINDNGILARKYRSDTLTINLVSAKMDANSVTREVIRHVKQTLRDPVSLDGNYIFSLDELRLKFGRVLGDVDKAKERGENRSVVLNFDTNRRTEFQLEIGSGFYVGSEEHIEAGNGINYLIRYRTTDGNFEANGEIRDPSNSEIFLLNTLSDRVS